MGFRTGISASSFKAQGWIPNSQVCQREEIGPGTYDVNFVCFHFNNIYHFYDYITKKIPKKLHVQAQVSCKTSLLVWCFFAFVLRLGGYVFESHALSSHLHFDYIFLSFSLLFHLQSLKITEITKILTKKN